MPVVHWMDSDETEFVTDDQITLAYDNLLDSVAELADVHGEAALTLAMARYFLQLEEAGAACH